MSNPLDFIMQQAQKMQSDMGKVEESLASKELVAEAGAGLVRIVINGRGQVKSISIDDELLKEEKSVLEDLLVAATNEATNKSEKFRQEQLSGLASGIDLQQFFNMKSNNS